MARNREPVFSSEICRRAQVEFTNADGTDPKLLFVAPPEGAIVDELVAFTNDTADKIVNIFESPNPTAANPTLIRIGHIKVPAKSGGMTAAADYVKPCDLLNQEHFRKDQADNRRTRIAGRCGLFVAPAEAITSTKTMYVSASWSGVRK